MKRLTDTNKWDLWFRKLAPSYKTTWHYLYDHCGPGGVWDRDDDVAKLFINDPALNLDEFFKSANEGKERLRILKDGAKWFIVDFVRVQCPTGLKRYTKNGEINKVHAPIYAELKKYGIDHRFYELEETKGSTEALNEPQPRLQDKDKDPDKEKDNGKQEGVQGEDGGAAASGHEGEALKNLSIAEVFNHEIYSRVGQLQRQEILETYKAHQDWLKETLIRYIVSSVGRVTVMNPATVCRWLHQDFGKFKRPKPKVTKQQEQNIQQIREFKA